MNRVLSRKENQSLSFPIAAETVQGRRREVEGACVQMTKHRSDLEKTRVLSAEGRESN